MNIFVTGGAGFIGSHIAEHFSSNGHSVTILDNLSTGCGNNRFLPKREAMLPEPASQYAISKLDCEYLARMF